jgi:phosphatidylserine/phosphatidylglycerophosphate/cardiolipin synthase-like enzyme
MPSSKPLARTQLVSRPAEPRLTVPQLDPHRVSDSSVRPGAAPHPDEFERNPRQRLARLLGASTLPVIHTPPGLARQLRALISGKRWKGAHAQPGIELLLQHPDLASIASAYDHQHGGPGALRRDLGGLLPDSRAQAGIDRIDRLAIAATGAAEYYADLAVHRFSAGRLSELGTLPLRTEESRLSLLAGRDYFLQGLVPAISAARDHVHVQMSEYLFDQVGTALADLLIDAHRRGVKVRVMLCTDGSVQTPGTPHFEGAERMKNAGVELIRVQPFSPTSPEGPRFHILHTKYIGVDGHTFFTGGGTIVDKAFGSEEAMARPAQLAPHGFPMVPDDDVPRTRDLLIKVEGGEAQALQASVFLRQWQFFGGQLETDASPDQLKARYLAPQPPASGERLALELFNAVPSTPNLGQQQVIELLNSAQHSVDFSMSYLTLDEVLAAASAAARRGVNVRIIVPALLPRAIDCFLDRALRAHFPALHQAGVELRAYQGNPGGVDQGYIHSKYLAADLGHPGAKAWFSTGNTEQFISGTPTGGGRSFDLSCVAEVTPGGVLEGQLRQMIDEDFSRARSRAFSEEEIYPSNPFTRLTNLAAWGLQQVARK